MFYFSLNTVNTQGFSPRYRLGDVVKVVGFHNQCPVVEFLYRCVYKTHTHIYMFIILSSRVVCFGVRDISPVVKADVSVLW